MRLLIDTNVILDACLSREPWREAAERLIVACAEEKVTGCVTASSITDIYYILNKTLHSTEQAKQSVQKIITILDVLDVNGTDSERALDLPLSDYEDALLACCAKRHKAEYIVTRNLKHFEGSPLKVISPGDLLKVF
ncbi:MAG: PIN domain-containing protein [Coriobacteriaceae bacterium]|jgi:predicted nucleic acid-binding protein|nr:PIN domain-containing protein [Coriobacteriaceae bacterium]